MFLQFPFLGIDITCCLMYVATIHQELYLHSTLRRELLQCRSATLSHCATTFLFGVVVIRSPEGVPLSHVSRICLDPSFNALSTQTAIEAPLSCPRPNQQINGTGQASLRLSVGFSIGSRSDGRVGIIFLQSSAACRTPNSAIH